MNFSKKVIQWYCKNKRDLPWCYTKDPYRIYLLEIIHQQTRVRQGIPYYEKFIKKFPTVHHLARAKEEDVLKMWQGLGYYSRARNLLHTAKFISQKLDGKFPDDYARLRKLKGVGAYTAGIIVSFAFNKPYPAVDGNVYRFLSRYFGIEIPIDSTGGKKYFAKKSLMLMDKKSPGLFNQALIEFGAVQCIPKNPSCEKCPLKRTCKAWLRQKVNLFPVKQKKRLSRIRYFNYLVLRKNGNFFIRKRTGNDIWKNLYDFPVIETERPISKAELLKRISEKSLLIKSESPAYKHILSHQIIYAKFWEVKSNKIQFIKKRYAKTGLWASTPTEEVGNSNIHRFAFPRLIERYLSQQNGKHIT